MRIPRASFQADFVLLLLVPVLHRREAKQRSNHAPASSEKTPDIPVERADPDDLAKEQAREPLNPVTLPVASKDIEKSDHFANDLRAGSENNVLSYSVRSRADFSGDFRPIFSTTFDTSGRGATHMRQEVYRVAYDEAHAELTEILGKFEQMRIRKDKIEKVVEALKPLLSPADLQQVTAVERSAAPAERKVAAEPSIAFPTPDPVPVASSQIPYPVQQAIQPSNDPFSRRADSASRDLQEYSRLFNGNAPRS